MNARQLSKKNYARTARLAAIAFGCAFGTASASAGLVNILPLGDSLSNGLFASPGVSPVYYLEDLLVSKGATHGVDYDLLGGINSGVNGATPILLSNGATHDSDRWTVNGALAAGAPNSYPEFVGSTGFFDPNNPVDNDLEFYLQTMATQTNQPNFPGLNDGVFTTDVGGSRQTRAADVVLLGIGTNAILGDSDQQPYRGDGSVIEADQQFRSLLVELQNQWQAGNIANDACIYVALIVPKAVDSSRGQGPRDDDTIRNVARYNIRVQQAIADMQTDPNFDPAFAGLFQTVDMFKIEVTDELLLSLGLDPNNPADRALLDNDGDIYVDWVLDMDESNPLAFNDSSVNINTNLMNSDRIHLTDLGYEILGNVWYNALAADGKAVPEPGAVALIMAGGLLTLRRRRG